MSYLRSGKKWKRGASVGRPSAPDDEDAENKMAAKRSRRPVGTSQFHFTSCTVF